MTEEEFCRYMLNELRQSYEDQTKPWIDKLVKIKQRSVPRFVILPSNPKITGPMPTENA